MLQATGGQAEADRRVGVEAFDQPVQHAGGEGVATADAVDDVGQFFGRRNRSDAVAAEQHRAQRMVADAVRRALGAGQVLQAREGADEMSEMNPSDAADALNWAVKEMRKHVGSDYINGLRLRLLEEMRDAKEREVLNG